MSTIALPSGLLCGQFAIGQHRYDLSEMSGSNGKINSRVMGPPRWTLSIAAPSNGLSQANAAIWEALTLQLRGRINYLSAYDIVKTVPRGTMRGTLTLSGAHSAGAVTLTVTGGSGQAATTILTGDWLQIGTGLGTSQLVKVMADATANGSGVITLTVEPPLRIAFSSGASVTWDHPIAYYKTVTDAPQWSYVPETGGINGFALDLIEQWS